MIHLWHCDRWLQVRDENKGKVVACPVCKGRIAIPNGEPVVAEAYRPRKFRWMSHMDAIILGLLALVIGVYLVMSGWMMDTTVALDSEFFGYQRVTNLSLQASQRNRIMIGIALGGLGSLVLATREIIARLQPSK